MEIIWLSLEFLGGGPLKPPQPRGSSDFIFIVRGALSLVILYFLGGDPLETPFHSGSRVVNFIVRIGLSLIILQFLGGDPLEPSPSGILKVRI